MLHSILITGSSLDQQLDHVQQLTNRQIKPEPDTLILTTSTSISIKAVRQIETFLSKKPYQQPQKTVLIQQADQLTLPAQNALLKTLEEPPLNSQIILLAPHQSKLIPTLVSRCQHFHLTDKISLSPKQLAEQQIIFNSITQTSAGQRINQSLNYSSNQLTALDFCQQQLLFHRSKLLQSPSPATLSILKSIQQTIEFLKANINPKLAIENLILRF